ncbi:MAG TPA: APC family permease [Dehalococcoidia bacterium]|nr:APC family permease [Dehalococcoidia bacterium]
MAESARPDESAPGAPGGRPGDRDRIRIPRQPAVPELESTEIVRGAKPGARFARVVRSGQRRFERGDDEGIFRATERATAPRTRAQQAWRQVRRVFVGSPISSEQLEEQRLPKWKALAVFSSDVMSSSAYATDEMLLVLVAAGTGALSLSVPIAVAIVLLLAVVTFSYRQTVRAYPSGGGAYIVARENFGDRAAVTAAAGLSVGYVLTVAVSIAAGVFAVVSAFPELEDIKVPIAVGSVGVITLLNLRGIRESGTIFAVPTYGFIFAFGLLITAGFIRLLVDPDLTADVPESAVEAGTGSVTIFLVLTAFSRGASALTGTEAISNGVPAFQKPESQNAATTLMLMAAILGVLFLGITLLANELEVRHAEDISAPAQIAKTVFGESPVFYFIQTMTALILFLAANTAYADFPRLGSILARDRFLPHQFQFRGDRLAFSNGIIFLGLASAALLVIFQAEVNRLIPLYAFGVFLSFTLSQGGMVVHWLRDRGPGWRRSMVINGIGASSTAAVAVIVGSTNFVDGAWISMVAIAVFAVMLWLIYQHYSGVDRAERVAPGTIVETRTMHRQAVLVPVDRITRAVLRSVEYARTISPNVRAIHVTDDVDAGNQLKREWEATVLDVPLIVIQSPYRSFVLPVISYIDALDQADPGQYVTVVLPEIRTVWPWQRFLHNQSAQRLRKALIERPNTVIVEVPYHLRESAAANQW